MALCVIFNTFLLSVSSGDNVTAHGPIVGSEGSIRDEPYTLPPGFSWDTLDLSNPCIVSYFLEKSQITIKLFQKENT